MLFGSLIQEALAAVGAMSITAALIAGGAAYAVYRHGKRLPPRTPPDLD